MYIHLKLQKNNSNKFIQTTKRISINNFVMKNTVINLFLHKFYNIKIWKMKIKITIKTWISLKNYRKLKRCLLTLEEILFKMIQIKKANINNNNNNNNS